MHAVRVDAVAAVLVGNLHRDMVEDHLVPAHHREDAIAGGEFMPRRPFGFAVLAVALELGRNGLFLFGGQIGRARCREIECKSVKMSGFGAYLQKIIYYRST